jgi:hypothetical protein
MYEGLNRTLAMALAGDKQATKIVLNADFAKELELSYNRVTHRMREIHKESIDALVAVKGRIKGVK